MKDIDIMSPELQRLYVDDPLFQAMMRQGCHAEDIILDMAKRNQELVKQNIELIANCTCQIGYLVIKD